MLSRFGFGKDSHSAAAMEHYYDETKTLADVIRDAEAEGRQIFASTADENDRTMLKESRIFCRHSSIINQSLLTIDLKILVETGRVQDLDVKPRPNRMVSVDYKLDLELAHDLDVTKFKERIKEVQSWHQEESVRNKYLAPLLALVQSSGTGKTRLMVAVRKQLTSARFILLCCKDEPKLSTKNTYDRIFAVPEAGTEGSTAKASLRAMVFGECRAVKEALEAKMGTEGTRGLEDRIPVLLLIDEAQNLVSDKDGYLLRALRWITREKPHARSNEEERMYEISVVLAGTNSSLSNYFPEPKHQKSDSRHMHTPGSYYEQGNIPFDPFFSLHTMGCLRKLKKGDETPSGSDHKASVQYSKAVMYGRPLFAVMQKNKDLESHENFILQKMLLGAHPSNLETNYKACMSMLGTRVQLGRSSVAVVSDLVSKGYAHLSYFKISQATPAVAEASMLNVAGFAFLPDPVCARLAMCMMDEQWKSDKSQVGDGTKEDMMFQGRPKRFWSERLSSIYNSMLCNADKGNFGEMASVLYLLFCADELRRKADCNYRTFSVSFDDWLIELDGSTMQEVKGGGNADDKVSASCKSSADNERFVSCIQFFRLHLRYNLKQMSETSFLSELYEMGCGIYIANNMPAFDLLVPVCIVHKADGNVTYGPLFVSVKTYESMSAAAANDKLFETLKRVLEEGLVNGMVLLCVTGFDGNAPKGYKNLLNQSQSDDLDVFKELKKVYPNKLSANTADICVQVVPKILCIYGDKFGIHNAVISTTPGSNNISEIFESHTMMLFKEKEENDSMKWMRSSSKKLEKEYAREVLGAGINNSLKSKGSEIPASKGKKPKK